jgi:translation initiation factor 3 subunit C
MSRFWAAGASSDDSDSASDDSDSSNDSIDDNNANSNMKKDGGRWVDFSDDSDSDDDVRVVKSAKERSLEAFTTHIQNLRSFMKQRDFKGIQSEFDELSKAMVKAKKVLAAGVPRQLVRILVDLEDFVKECLEDKVAFKKLTPNQGRALNRMKLTLHKHNKPYQIVIDHYRKNPVTEQDADDDDGKDDSDDSGDDSSSSSSSSSRSDATPTKAKKKDASSESGSDSDSVSFGYRWHLLCCRHALFHRDDLHFRPRKLNSSFPITASLQFIVITADKAVK